MRAVVLLVGLAACGRVGFEPLDDDAGSGSGSAHRDAATSPDGAPVDAPVDTVTACASAIPIQVDVPKSVNTCDGPDLLDGCGPPNTDEVVFELVVPATAGYSARAYNAGTMNVSNSTALLNATCAVSSSCAGVLGRNFSAGQVIYFVVEASSGGCANIDFVVNTQGGS